LTLLIFPLEKEGGRGGGRGGKEKRRGGKKGRTKRAIKKEDT